MAKASIPAGSTGADAALVAEVVTDLTANDFDATADGSAVTITAGKKGSLGTATYNVLAAARTRLLARGAKPPQGLTLRSRRTSDPRGNDADGWTVEVVYFYGDPTDHTDAAHVGK